MRAASRVTLDGITVSFPSASGPEEPVFRALDGVTLSFARGEVHAVLGENGAGKSTLMHVLSGLIRPSAGSVVLDGEPARFASSADALAAGIAMVHQRPRLADGLSTVDNALLGDGSALVRRRETSRRMAGIAERWGIALEISREAGRLSPADRLRSALLGALLTDPSFLVLDEPTAVLDPAERDRFLSAARSAARSSPLGVVLVTHKIDDVLKWSDRVTVLRKGRLEASLPVDEVPGGRERGGSWLSSMLSGDSAAVPSDDTRARAQVRGFALEVRALTARPQNRNHLVDVSFTALPGEITGVVGHPGSGIDTLEDALCGMAPAASGEIAAGDATVPARLLTPSWLRAHGVALVPSNRAFRGSHPSLTVRDVLLAGRGDAPARRKGEEDDFASGILGSEDLPVSPDRLAGTLSGGQLQRLILARELGGREKPRAVILAEPEWGLDIASVARLRERLKEAARSGIAVLVLTDTPETMAVSDFYSRTIPLREGRIA